MSDIETRLGRIEGSLDTYTRTLTGVIDRMERRQTRIEKAVGDVRVANAKHAGIITMFSASLSACVAFIVTYFNKGP